ncbi:MAG: hypothetical protein JNM17_22735 [Archangium sp.]|nr:hypothetical protein [Archangium sp.]
MRFALGLVVFSLATGCATTAPRFDQELATTFAQDDMHKLETPELELYYPANYADSAKRVAARAAECIRLLRAKDVDRRERDRALLFLTSANYNNAYVGGLTGGEPLISVNTLSQTSELFHFYGLGGANAGDVSCHEMFHLVHYEQTHGFWNVVNTVFGPLLPPQAFLERWFTEGVAQFYEGRLARTVGRPFSPFYRGSFDSFVASRGGHVQPGDLQLIQRELNPHSGAYLTGLHFIEWLATKYGEDKLWQLIDLQSTSVFSPFGYTLRFQAIYGLTVGALIDEWEAELVKTLVVRTRPATEKSLIADVGQLARLATHAASGTIAVVFSGNEHVPYLRILNADGTLRAEQRLTKIGPDRESVFVGPGTMSGLSFTADGKYLYLLNDDLIDRGDTLAQIWKVDAQTGETIKVYQRVGRGMAGSVSAEGRYFTFAEFPPEGRARLIDRELETETSIVIEEFPPGVSVGAPAWNAAHTQLIYSRLDPNGWNLVLRKEDGTSVDLTTDGAFNYGARWADDTHIVVARTAGKYLQAHRMDVTDPTNLERLTDAPYGVLDPSPAPEKVVFAARDGIGWSLDTTPLTDAAPLPPIEPTAIPEWHVTPDLEVKKDEAYSSLDHLFVPQLRVPTGNISCSTTAGFACNGSVGLSVMGRDRLSRHTWAINGMLGIPNFAQNSVQVGYRNASLAPWAIVASASRFGSAAGAYWTGLLSIGRTAWTVPFSFGVQTEIVQPFGEPVEKYIGPYFQFSYGAGDGTSYAGAQRSLSFSLDVAGYPRIFGSDRDVLDIRSTVAVAIPLPLSKRHSFVISGVGRALPGAVPGAMQVGGISSALFHYPLRSGFPDSPAVFLPGVLVEGVRGYDDFAIRAQHVAIFNARYRYSFIIDRGTASFLYLFPSFFFRQIDLEAFGSGAVTETQLARAAGAALTFRVNFGGFLPVSFGYQFAYRFDFGLPPLHSLTFGLE